MGVHFTDRQLALVRCRDDDGRVELALSRPVEGADERARVLAELVREHGLERRPCVCMLSPGDYQLLQVEAPDVDPAELRAAIRWRIKDLIDYHVDDAVVDAFAVPESVNRGAVKMMFAVSARLRRVQELVDTVQGSGLWLQAVDVAELGLRNIAAQVPEQAGGVVVLALGERRGLITVCRDQALYLARGLDFGSEALIDEGTLRYESLVLELQRSLDYYESQLAGVPASRILVAPMDGPRDRLVEYLNEQLGVPAFGLDLHQVVEFDQTPEPAAQAPLLYALGGALRRERKAL
ncbi:pilus assembly protein PilM [Alkalilimnicola sp. S0819]|uniref:pilus assembly protein PilM n=1 Tax=Alkalilimnicola sp. S0819 TaxID=2613922 RepID=UPI0012615266|nr:pilus assembly protein PilM [Alkalilimnicola sp. S0819]KAB7622645.1 hypothetical protein F3N43_12305 [Alkalilimnicola sp. S0819]MPQ17416.1 hypothetical protein [Alkalilimnicola sp. S0819]